MQMIGKAHWQTPYACGAGRQSHTNPEHRAKLRRHDDVGDHDAGLKLVLNHDGLRLFLERRLADEKSRVQPGELQKTTEGRARTGRSGARCGCQPWALYNGSDPHLAMLCLWPANDVSHGSRTTEPPPPRTCNAPFRMCAKIGILSWNVSSSRLL